jgi:hypothetical protein
LGATGALPAIAPERHLYQSRRTSISHCVGRGLSTWAVADLPTMNHPTYSASAMRTSLDMRANIAARRACEQSDCDEAWIRADERRLRQTEQMHVLAAHGAAHHGVNTRVSASGCCLHTISRRRIASAIAPTDRFTTSALRAVGGGSCTAAFRHTEAVAAAPVSAVTTSRRVI